MTHVNSSLEKSVISKDTAAAGAFVTTAAYGTSKAGGERSVISPEASVVDQGSRADSMGGPGGFNPLRDSRDKWAEDRFGNPSMINPYIHPDRSKTLTNAFRFSRMPKTAGGEGIFNTLQSSMASRVSSPNEPPKQSKYARTGMNFKPERVRVKNSFAFGSQPSNSVCSRNTKRRIGTHLD